MKRKFSKIIEYIKIYKILYITDTALINQILFVAPGSPPHPQLQLGAHWVEHDLSKQKMFHFGGDKGHELSQSPGIIQARNGTSSKTWRRQSVQRKPGDGYLPLDHSLASSSGPGHSVSPASWGTRKQEKRNPREQLQLLLAIRTRP